jgi:hypothetical protein
MFTVHPSALKQQPSKGQTRAENSNVKAAAWHSAHTCTIGSPVFKAHPSTLARAQTGKVTRQTLNQATRKELCGGQQQPQETGTRQTSQSAIAQPSRFKHKLSALL